MPTSKEVTIYDIARKLNISAATVSRGLHNHPAVSKKTKKKIFELASEIGYQQNQIARNLRNQKTNTIGVIVGKITSNFQASAISGIEHVANSQGYNLIISQSSEQILKEAANAKTMFNSRVDGLLVSLAYDTNSLDHFEVFFKKNIPVIFFDRVMEQSESTCVVIDNVNAAYKATAHLIEQGCKRIVHITAPQQQNVYKDRLKGYKQALNDHKIQLHDDDLIVGNLSHEAGADAAAVILKMFPMPDGVFVANDNCAVACMQTLKQNGIRIPKDIAFVGFNNDPVSSVVEPNLTTVNYSGYQVGEMAALQLINYLRGASATQTTDTIILKSDLVIRASSIKNNT
jgi:LacI family transcriptional regulator